MVILIQFQSFPVGTTVLLKNLRRAERKGGKATDPWTGPYTVASVLTSGSYKLKNNKGLELKKAYSAIHVKEYVLPNNDSVSSSSAESIAFQ